MNSNIFILKTHAVRIKWTVWKYSELHCMENCKVGSQNFAVKLKKLCYFGINLRKCLRVRTQNVIFGFSRTNNHLALKTLLQITTTNPLKLISSIIVDESLQNS